MLVEFSKKGGEFLESFISRGHAAQFIDVLYEFFLVFDLDAVEFGKFAQCDQEPIELFSEHVSGELFGFLDREHSADCIEDSLECGIFVERSMKCSEFAKILLQDRERSVQLV